MAKRIAMCAFGAASILAGCSSPFDRATTAQVLYPRSLSSAGTTTKLSVYREQSGQEDAGEHVTLDMTARSYVEYALYHSPEIERAYQQWRIASERLPQVSALPDPRLSVGYFLSEVETRVGPQQARVGLKQTFPWLGTLSEREDAASKGALAAWFLYQNAQLGVVERVMVALHDLAYLDSAIEITQESYKLLSSFEEVIRARYRVGAGGHPELIRVQVELGQLEDRVIQLESLRPTYVAALNAVLNRPPMSQVDSGILLEMQVATQDAAELAELSHEWNPVLLALGQRVEQQRALSGVARKNGYPDLTVGLDYIVTGDAASAGVAGSGDDPIMLSVGMNLPIWRDKYDAGVRESIARRLSISRDRQARSNEIEAQVYRAWFEHTDADRRVRLYEETLIPKAQDSLSASLAGFRTGESEFLDLLDTERTLLEFAIEAERARADRGKALASLDRLVGRAVSTQDAIDTQVTRFENTIESEVQP